MAGCGGDEPAPTDPDAVLEQTFGGGNEVDSGVAEISFEFTIVAGETSDSQTIAVDGPFELPDEGAAPRFDLALTVGEAEAGLTSTGEAGYLELGDAAYEVDPLAFARLTEAFEADPEPLTALDPPQWFRDTAVEGTRELEGVETVRVSGPADPRAISGDLVELTERLELPPLGLFPGGAATLDVFSGADDGQLRAVDLDIEYGGQLEDGQPFESRIAFSLALSDVDEVQRIEAPAGARPISDLEGSESRRRCRG